TFCATFKFTESPSGYAQIACAPPPLPAIRSVQIPPFIPPVPINVCPDPNGGGGNVGGGGGGNVPIVNPIAPGGGGSGGGSGPGGVVGFTPGGITTGVNVPNTVGCQTCPTNQGGQVTAAAAAVDNTLLGLDLTGFSNGNSLQGF